MEVNARKDNNQSMEKISLLYDIIKKDVNSFKLKHSNAGYLFDIKFNEKDKKVKVFLTLLKKSETNPHNEDIDFLIECEENYPQKEPKVFCITNVIKLN